MAPLLLKEPNTVGKLIYQYTSKCVLESDHSLDSMNNPG